jgi:2-polyprenyl-6-hydroxyphenyl methylase/3-demethylubiquinone-9 3-methyltransferase
MPNPEIRPNPQPLNPDAVPVEPATEYAYTSARPNHSHPYLLQAVGPFLRSLPPGSRVLDFGCGNGSLLAGFTDCGFELHGVDASKSGILQARLHHRAIAFHLADVTAPLPPDLVQASFDAIVCTEVIEHVFEPRKLVRNAFTLLKPGGQLLITMPYHGYLKNLALAVTGRMDAHFTALWDHGHIKFFSRRTLSALLEEANFQQLRFSGVGRVPLFWMSMVFVARKPGESSGGQRTPARDASSSGERRA